MKIRLHLDEDSMDQALIRGLRAHGVDVLTARDTGMIERPDQEHLAYALGHGRVLCTFNVRDFYRLHTEYQETGRSHAGMILVAQRRYSIGEHVRRILKLAAIKPSESMRNQVELLSAWKPE